MTKGWVKENGVFFLSAGDTVVAPHCSFAVAGWRRRKRWGAITCKWQRFRALCLQSQGNYSHMRPARRILSGSSGEKKVKLLSNFLIFSPPLPPLLELFLSAHNHKFFTITFFFFKDLKRLENEEREKKKLINNCWSVTTFEVPKVCHYHLLWGHIKKCISWHMNCANWSFALTFGKSFFCVVLFWQRDNIKLLEGPSFCESFESLSIVRRFTLTRRLARTRQRGASCISGELSPPCGRYQSQHRHGLLSEQCNLCLSTAFFF